MINWTCLSFEDHLGLFLVSRAIIIYKRQVHVTELESEVIMSPYKWWLGRDYAFLNHETLDFHFGCSCNQAAIKDMVEINNRIRAQV